jgi:putative FmdB family regulatory protein
MPIYEYICSACGKQVEIMQSISDRPLKQCPKCKRRTLKKMMSASGFVLKGSGWYVTDFRDKKPAGKDKEADKGKASEEKKTESVEKADKPASEGKSEAKKETKPVKKEGGKKKSPEK